tara:strand:- start:17363 stop:18418 length:1056 start_codon:yes stop_codon:yes gene_type:complete
MIMTPMERKAGRFMRAPDHPGEGGGESSGGSTAESQDSGDAGTTTGEDTESALAKEFGQEPEGETGGSEEGDSGKPADTSNELDDDDDDDDDDGDTGDSGETGEDGEGGDQPETNEPKQETDLERRLREAEAESARLRKAAEEAGVDLDVAASDQQLPEEPDPSKYKFGEYDQNYIKDLAKYEAKMEVLTEQADARFKAEAAELDVKWQNNVAEGVKRYADFNEKVVEGAKTGKWKCSAVLAVGIKDSQQGADIAYHLASEPSESDRISRLSPLEQAREFGRLEERFAAKARRAARRAERGEDPAAQRHQSKAPKPPKRQVRGAGGTSRPPADTGNFADFEKLADGILSNQ